MLHIIVLILERIKIGSRTFTACFSETIHPLSAIFNCLAAKELKKYTQGTSMQCCLQSANTARPADLSYFLHLNAWHTIKYIKYIIFSLQLSTCKVFIQTPSPALHTKGMKYKFWSFYFALCGIYHVICKIKKKKKSINHPNKSLLQS